MSVETTALVGWEQVVQVTVVPVLALVMAFYVMSLLGTEFFSKTVVLYLIMALTGILYVGQRDRIPEAT